MKTFIIINGKSVRTIYVENMEKAIAWAENYCDHSKEVIVREIETEIAIFQNSFEDWQETHYEIVEILSAELVRNEDDSLAVQTITQEGTGGLYLLAKRLTDEFQEKYTATLWGSTEELCFFEKIEEFMSVQKYVEPKN